MSRHKQSIKEDDEPTEQELRENLKEYITFIDEVLEPQLKIAVSEREEVESEIKEYNELKSHLQLMLRQNNEHQSGDNDNDDDDGTEGGRNNGPSDESLVDLGYGMVYCRAKILDRERVFVHVGMGFHTEFTLLEAVQFIERRVDHLRRNVQPGKVDKAREVAGHLENALQLLESLGKEIRNSSSNSN